MAAAESRLTQSSAIGIEMLIMVPSIGEASATSTYDCHLVLVVMFPQQNVRQNVRDSATNNSAEQGWRHFTSVTVA
jgi:hypothetical protein